MKQEAHDSEKQKAVANTISEYGVAGDNNLTACKGAPSFSGLKPGRKIAILGTWGRGLVASFGAQRLGAKAGDQNRFPF